MLNVESHIYSTLKQIRKAGSVNQANQHAYYALGYLRAKKEDGEVTGEQEEFLLGCVENELKVTESRLKNKTIDQTLALFRPRESSREEERLGERSRKSIVPVTRYRKKSIS